MRPIDADALTPLIQEDKIEGKTLDIIKALGDGLQAETLNQACDRHIKIINSLPTIDAAPVVHGMWIETDDILASGACSVCGWKPYYYEDDVAGMPYCPNCGAKMDGGKDDEQV